LQHHVDRTLDLFASHARHAPTRSKARITLEIGIEIKGQFHQRRLD